MRTRRSSIWAALGWAAALLGIAFVGLGRLIADAGTCGDDGPVDYYGDAEARWYCNLIDDRLRVFDVGESLTFDPGSIWWFVFAIPASVLAGVLVLRIGRGFAAAAVAALAALVFLPAVVGIPGFAAFYVLPVAVTLAASLLALGAGRTGVAVRMLGVAGVLSIVLILVTFAIASHPAR